MRLLIAHHEICKWNCLRGVMLSVHSYPGITPFILKDFKGILSVAYPVAHLHPMHPFLRLRLPI